MKNISILKTSMLLLLFIHNQSFSQDKPKLFERKVSFTCNKITLNVISYCYKKLIDDTYHQCPQQDFIVKNNNHNALINPRKYVIKKVYYKNYKSEETRAWDLSCLALHQHHYVKVGYGNMHSCQDCEWMDYYNAETGAYSGSAKSPYEGDMIGRFYLSDERLEELNNFSLISYFWISDIWDMDAE